MSKPSGFPVPPATNFAPSSIPTWIKDWILSNWVFETTGPIWSPSFVATSTFIEFAKFLTLSTASSYIDFSTNILVGALQDCPVFLKHLKAPLSTASASASLNIILAPLPPSSKLTLLKSFAAFSEIKAPALVEPVNETILTSGWLVKASPVTAPSPLTKLKTPSGNFISSIISANIIEDKGAISDGLSTIVQPVAIAGITLRQTWFIGQFQGVINAQTPFGSCKILLFGAWSPNISSNVYSFKTLI